MANFDNAKKKKTTHRKWYIINSKKYSYYIWALPLIPFLELADRIKEYQSKRRVWSEEKATKILDYVLPQVLEWVEEENAFYYCMEWGVSSLWRKARRRDRKWAYKFDYRLQNFIKDGYENAEYTKTIIQEYCDDTWVKFVEKA